MELTIDNRKLEINKRNNLRLSYRDLIFWQNNSIHINNENEIKTKLIAFINSELYNLYSYAKPENFLVNTANNPDLERYFNRQLQGYRARG